MSYTNKAAWLQYKQQKPFHISSGTVPTPSPRQILIKIRALAINPCDAGIQNLGIIWETFPVVIGSDLAGEIVEIGSSVTNFKVGDRVLACVEKGAFQEHCLAEPELVAKIPNDVSYTQAAVLPLGMSTAAVSLFETENMGLELPRLIPEWKGKVVLVWGASSSVGSCAVQLLKSAGYEVAATAGASNSAYCNDLGASYIFDHKSPSVEQEIIAAIKTSGLEFAGVFSAVMDKNVLSTCLRIAEQLGQDEKSRIVGTVIPPGMTFNLPEVPAGVRIGFCKGPCEFLPESELREIFGWEKPERVSEVGPKVFGTWMTEALESGQLKCKPDPFVVGKGLEFVQEACDLMSKGVSARKLVVEL